MIRGTSAAANKNSHQWDVRSSTTHRWLFCRALHLTPSDKKLGLALGKVFFETTETTETKETTAKQSIIRMIINFSVVPAVSAVPVVSALALIEKFSFHLSVFSLNNKPRRCLRGLLFIGGRLLQHAELLTNLNEGLNATVELLSSVTCRYLNTDTCLALWNYWVVETCYEYTLLLQLCSEVL